MPRTKWRDPRFSERLAAARKARGLTQVELARLVGITQRALSHYETQDAFPPAPILIRMARAMKMSLDEFLGLKVPKPDRKGIGARQSPRIQRLWKRFQLLLELPDRDQRAVVRLILTLTKDKARDKRVRSGASSRAIVSQSNISS